MIADFSKILTNSIFRFIGVVCLILIAFAFYPLQQIESHRFHSSLTLMEFNEKEKTVEITIQLFAKDLVQVLESKHGGYINLENTPKIDALIKSYLVENFYLKDFTNQPFEIKWIGKELSLDLVYLYLELPTEETLEGKKLKNTIFFETFNEQTNLVICKFDKKKADLLFKVGDIFKEIQVGSHKGE